VGAASTWAPSAPGERYGLHEGPLSAVSSELHAVASPALGAAASAQLWNPANQNSGFAGLAALTFGLMAVSTTVRVGGAKASLALGK
jgi:hypothetical protein